MIKVTYQNKKGEIIEKYRQVYTTHTIGETTCWGWKVLDIKYSYNGKYYSMYDYDKIISKKIKREEKIYFFKKEVIKFNRQLINAVVLLLLIREISSVM